MVWEATHNRSQTIAFKCDVKPTSTWRDTDRGLDRLGGTGGGGRGTGTKGGRREVTGEHVRAPGLPRQRTAGDEEGDMNEMEDGKCWVWFTTLLASYSICLVCISRPGTVLP